MKRIEAPGDVVLYEGKLARVVGIAEGRTIILEFPDERPCPTCRNDRQVHLLESSALFQQGVKPVRTVKDQ